MKISDQLVTNSCWKVGRKKEEEEERKKKEQMDRPELYYKPPVGQNGYKKLTMRLNKKHNHKPNLRAKRASVKTPWSVNFIFRVGTPVYTVPRIFAQF